MNEKENKELWKKYYNNKKKNPPKIITSIKYYQEANQPISFNKNACENCGGTNDIKTRFGGQKLCRPCHFSRVESEYIS